MIRDMGRHDTFNGAVATVTSYDPFYRDYTLSFVGAFRGYHGFTIRLTPADS